MDEAAQASAAADYDPRFSSAKAVEDTQRPLRLLRRATLLPRQAQPRYPGLNDERPLTDANARPGTLPASKSTMTDGVSRPRRCRNFRGVMPPPPLTRFMVSQHWLTAATRSHRCGQRRATTPSRLLLPLSARTAMQRFFPYRAYRRHRF
jgi:hypothetical protein